MSDPAVIIVMTCVLAIAVIAFVLLVRPQDIPATPPPSPFAHLDERKAAIYENLRDLQFEFRVGKLSDEDYKNTKIDLQKELAAVLAEVDRLKGELTGATAVAAAAPAAAKRAVKQATILQCPHCAAKFEREMKFCGECGKAMTHA